MHYYLGVWTRCYATLFNLVILASRPTTTPFATLLYWRPNKKNWRALGGRTKQKIDGRTLFGNASLFFLTHQELFLNLYFFKVAQKQEIFLQLFSAHFDIIDPESGSPKITCENETRQVYFMSFFCFFKRFWFLIQFQLVGIFSKV